MIALAAALFLATVRPFPELKALPRTPALPRKAGVRRFTFAVAGDNRPDSCQTTSPAFAPILQHIAAARPAFVLWDGDTIAGKDPANVEQQYGDFLAALRSNMPGVPVFNAPGNHELARSTTECHDVPETDGALLRQYKAYMGEPFGVFRYGNAALVAVNTDDALDDVPPPGGRCAYNGFVGATQLQRFMATLGELERESGIDHIFLFMHRPVHDAGDAKHQIAGDPSTPYGKQIENFRRAIDAIHSKKISFIFASHDHRFSIFPADMQRPNGPYRRRVYVQFIITGGAGAPLSGCTSCRKPGTGNRGAYYHWLSVEVNGPEAMVTVKPLTNRTLCNAWPPVTARPPTLPPPWP